MISGCLSFPICEGDNICTKAASQGCYKDLRHEKCLEECVANGKLPKKKKISIGYCCYIITINVIIPPMEGYNLSASSLSLLLAPDILLPY